MRFGSRYGNLAKTPLAENLPDIPPINGPIIVPRDQIQGIMA